MKLRIGRTATLVLMMTTLAGARAPDGRITVVAAENFYGNVARQIGGGRVAVASILRNRDQDPHLFEASPAVVREIAAAQIVVYNGAGYDPWMTKVLRVAPRRGRSVIVAADLMHEKETGNPHLWYDPATMLAVAKALAAALAAADPAHKRDYAARLQTFVVSLAPLNKKIAAIRSKYAGAAVTASEPIAGYMASALKLRMRNRRFQRAIMNGTEPSASDIAAFERDLKTHKVRIMFYNKQASDNVVQRLLAVARAEHVPVVGVTETSPLGMSYQNWMSAELDETAKALAGSSS